MNGKAHSHLFPPLGIPFPPSPSQVIRSFPTTPNDRSVILVQTRRAHYVVSEVVVGGTESKNKNSRVVWSVYMVPERALDPSVIQALGSVQEGYSEWIDTFCSSMESGQRLITRGSHAELDI